jgi:hypothetical protein
MSRHAVPERDADADRSKFNARFLQASRGRLDPCLAPRNPLLSTVAEVGSLDSKTTELVKRHN